MGGGGGGEGDWGWGGSEWTVQEGDVLLGVPYLDTDYLRLTIGYEMHNMMRGGGGRTSPPASSLYMSVKHCLWVPSPYTIERVLAFLTKLSWQHDNSTYMQSFMDIRRMVLTIFLTLPSIQ